MATVIPDQYYTTNDASYKTDFDTSLVRNLNIDTENDYDVYAASNIIAYPGYTVDDLMTIENMFGQMETQYNKATEVIQISNDLQNVNQFINNNYKLEKTRIDHVLNTSENNVYISRENFMLSKYNIAFNKFVTYVLEFTLFIAIICGFVVCFTFYEKFKISWKAAGVILFLIATIYAFGVIVFYRQTLVRRKDDWTKYYFSTPDSLNGTFCNK